MPPNPRTLPEAAFIQAEWRPRAISVVEDYDAVPLPSFPPELRELFARYAFDIGGFSTCEVPGRVVVTVPSILEVTVCLGNTRTRDRDGLVKDLRYALEAGLPKAIVCFLQVCVGNGLHLNKFMRRKQQFASCAEERPPAPALLYRVHAVASHMPRN